MRAFLLAPLVAVTALTLGCSGGEPHSDTRVIVLGIDGLDPELLQERIGRGMLPNFQKVVESGTLAALQTSWPPQSPVAWSNFITGCNPGKHGLYDFIHADRHNYGVASSMSTTEDIGLELSLFGYKLPLTGGEQTLTRAFPAFWEVLDEADVPVAVYRMPANFPPAPTRAITYPDMGAPDLAGAASGKAFLWTESTEWSAKESDSYYVIPVELNRGRPGLGKLSAQLRGPDNPLLDLDEQEEELAAAVEAGDTAKAARLRAEIGRARATTAAFTAYVDMNAELPQLAVKLEDAWGIAPLGEWTDWVPVSFSLGLSSVSGWTRFLFKGIEPFELYASPIQIDPFAPVMPVSTPDDASVHLAEAIGPYYTQGFPDAYKSYKAGLLTTPEFVSQSDTVLEERGEMLGYAMDEFDRRGGLLFFYYGSLDLRCHMLWHCQDDLHPHQEEPGVLDDGTIYAEQIDRVYTQMDAELGRLLERMEAWPDCELIIMSDHGFAPFRRKMHVNDWLLQEGYLVLKEGEEAKGRIWAGELDDSIVDWSKSVAYCVGFNGIILNRKDREPLGIVDETRADALLEEMKGKLLALRDGGKPVFTRVLRASEVFEGPMLDQAPDLQLGFNVGFGASDECATGEITGEGVIVDNDSRWSGSHLMDPELVRGTILTKEKREFSKDPALEDITATLYRLFDVNPPEGLDGQALY